MLAYDYQPHVSVTIIDYKLLVYTCQIHCLILINTTYLYLPRLHVFTNHNYLLILIGTINLLSFDNLIVLIRITNLYLLLGTLYRLKSPVYTF